MIQKTILASFTIPIGLLTTFIFWWLVLFAFDRITQLDIVPPTQGYAQSLNSTITSPKTFQHHHHYH